VAAKITRDSRRNAYILYALGTAPRASRKGPPMTSSFKTCVNTIAATGLVFGMAIGFTAPDHSVPEIFHHWPSAIISQAVAGRTQQPVSDIFHHWPSNIIDQQSAVNKQPGSEIFHHWPSGSVDQAVGTGNRAKGPEIFHHWPSQINEAPIDLG
jgi:hypothetical protein